MASANINENQKRIFVKVAALAALLSTTAYGQVVPRAASADAPVEITVTARKKTESLLAVPVTISVVSAEDISRRGIVSIDALNTLVSQVQFGDNSGSLQGGSVVIRGIGSADTNTTADQSVSFNIDGAEVARSSVRRMAQMDMAQIEVLKGPQALFFGKNSPGGVVSIRTADPTNAWEAQGRVGYEAIGHEVTGDGYVSGPLTDTLGIRIAGYASDLRGWSTNTTPATSPYDRDSNYYPHDREAAGRITLKFEPSSRFSARFKFNYSVLRTGGPAENSQFIYCPLGEPQYGGSDDCTADNRTSHAGYGPNFAAIDQNYGSGDPFLKQWQILSSLELNYAIAENLSLTSVTSIYKVDINAADNYTDTYIPSFIFVDSAHFNIYERAEEIRLASSFKGPINFTIGTYLQKSDFRDVGSDIYNAIDPILYDQFAMHQKGSHYSFFGQARYYILDDLELSGGGRFSHEKKDFEISGVGVPPLVTPKMSWNNFSPETSLNWRPTRRLTLYGSYKKGFLSGGFNVFGVPYNQQTTEGFEAGVKAVLFDGSVRFNAAAYTYTTDGLQVSLVNGANVSTVNAGKSRVRGLEGDVNWTTPIKGLNLHTSAGYNQGRYLQFNISCYTGQTINVGCNLAPTGGAYTLQDLTGRPLEHAPSWTANGGFVYEHAVSNSAKITLSGDAAYTSGYYSNPKEAPATWESQYLLVDATAALASRDSDWELALIGKNLTNKYYYTSSSESIFTGSGTGTSGPAVPADLVAAVSRGRQIMFRVTYKYH